MSKLFKLNLQLFDGGAAAAAGAGEGAAAGNALATQGVQTNTDNGGVDLQAEFDGLVAEGGKYKAEFDSRVKAAVDKRVKNLKGYEQQVNDMSPVLQIIGERYGVDPRDSQGLANALLADNSYLEQEAMEQGLTTDQLAAFKRMEYQNRLYQQREAQAKAMLDYNRWNQEAEELKNTLNPGFDFDTELQNPQFREIMKVAPTIKEYYNKQLLEDTKPNLVHDQFGQKRSIPKGNGKTIEWRKFSSLAPALTPLTEGVTPDGNKLHITAITSTPEQFGDYIVLSDVLQLTAYDPIILETTKVLGNQAGLTMDTVIRDILNQGLNVSYASKTVSGTVTAVTSRANLGVDSLMSVEFVQKIVRKLKTQNVPTINGNYVAIIHPDVAFDLMRDEEWIDAHKYATPENIYNGEIGKIANVRFVESTQAKIWNDNTCPVKTAAVEADESSGTEAAPATYYSVYSTLFLGADAYGCVDIAGGGLEHIIKQKGSAGVADPLDQRSSVGWKGFQTAVILDGTRMVRAETLSSFSGDTSAN